MPCNVGSPGQGVVEVSYGASTGGDVSMKCVPAALHELSVVRAGSGAGAVMSSPAGINCGSDCTQEFSTGSRVTLTATASVGSAFAGWSGPCTGTASTCSVTVDAAMEVTARFARTSMLTVSLTSERAGFGSSYGGGTVSGPDGLTCTIQPGANHQLCQRPFLEGSVINLTAAPFGDDTFSWGGACTGRVGNPCTITMDTFKTVSVAFTG